MMSTAWTMLALQSLGPRVGRVARDLCADKSTDGVCAGPPRHGAVAEEGAEPVHPHRSGIWRHVHRRADHRRGLHGRHRLRHGCAAHMCKPVLASFAASHWCVANNEAAGHAAAVHGIIGVCQGNACAPRAGILLAVTIIYQYFETYEKEKAQAGGCVLF